MALSVTPDLLAATPEQPLPDIPYLKFREPVTLTNCDREPIHVPGHSQAHGAIVALDPGAPDLAILQASANLADFCGVAVTDLLSSRAEILFGAENTSILADAMSDGRLEANPLYLFTGPVCGQGSFHATAHTYSGVLMVELEPAGGVAPPGPAAAPRPDSHGLLRHALSRLRSAATLDIYCKTVCEAVQQLSGFDRVMVYKFHDDGHGEVIAEVIGKADMREPYLGLHYPESDIPKQARALYLLNSIRLMPDGLYEPAPIEPALNPLTNRPLDMTHCLLRGYSRMYTEYLTNMGARASMSLAIVKDNALWGLIACHHQTYRWVPYDVRASCEFLVDVVSLQIGDKVAHEEAEERELSLNVHRRLVESMARHGSVLAGLTDESASGVSALTLIDADGCAVFAGAECRLLGATPPEDEIRKLVAWLNKTHPAVEVWKTDALATVHPEGAFADARWSGLLALRVTTAADGDRVLWFRTEASQNVSWGGDPNKPYETGPLGDRLTPRKSFGAWQETVRGRSLPWRTADVDAALRLKSAITQVIVRRVEELARLNAELERSNVELDSFTYVASHDLKEPLRGISNYIRFLREDHGDELTPEAGEKLDTVVRLTRRMDNLLDSLLHYSRLGRQALVFADTDLNSVVTEVLETLWPRLQTAGTTASVPRPFPTPVSCDGIQVDELLTNLISNAIKYNSREAGAKRVEIGWLDAAESVSSLPDPTVFFIRDNGIGIHEKHFGSIFRIFTRLHARGEFDGGTGAGLTIAQKIVERHGGRLWLESVIGEGTSFFFTLAPSPTDAGQR